MRRTCGSVSCRPGISRYSASTRCSQSVVSPAWCTTTADTCHLLLTCPRRFSNGEPTTINAEPAALAEKASTHAQRVLRFLRCTLCRVVLLHGVRSLVVRTEPLAQLEFGNRLAVDFVGTVGEANGPRVRPHRGQREIVADP